MKKYLFLPIVFFKGTSKAIIMSLRLLDFSVKFMYSYKNRGKDYIYFPTTREGKNGK